MNTNAKTPSEKLNNPCTTERSSKYAFKEGHMPFLYRKLVSLYGHKGIIVPSDRVNKNYADALRRMILQKYQSYEIDAAHYACVDDMRKMGASGGTSTSKARMNFGTGQIEQDDNYDALEDALREDNSNNDTKRDNAWLDNILGNDTKALTEEPKAEQSGNVLDLSQFVLKRELAPVLAELKDNLRSNASFTVNFKSDQTEFNEDIAGRVLSNTERIISLENKSATVIEIKHPDIPETTKVGLAHKHFPHLLAMAHARETIWVYGPAGTGKSTAGEQLALALFNDKKRFFTNGKMENQFEVLGYRNSTGEYQRTQFRDAYEHGGIYMADEIDGSMPSAVLALNGALANGHCPFPDKTVDKHPDFIFIGAANTTGVGGTLEYVGRMKHDAAFLDRFVTLDWPLDEGLEDAITDNKKWLAYVRLTRANLARNPIKGHLITPRASIKGSKLLSYGVDADKVIEGTLKKGLSDTQWQQIAPRNHIKDFTS